MKDSLPARLLLGAVLPVMVLILWHFTAKRSTVIPSINEVIDVLIHPKRVPERLDAKPLLDNVIISVLRVLTGFILSVITAIPLGFIISASKTARRLFSPAIEMLRPICPIAWMPIAIIIFGFKSIGSTIWGTDAYMHDILSQMKYAPILIIWWGAFFPILLNTSSGVNGVKNLYIDAAKMLGANRLTLYRKVILPASLPSIFTGFRVGMGIAWMVIVAAEFFPGTTAGLGYMITTSHQVAEYEYAFAAIIIIAFLGFCINYIMKLMSRKFEKWEALER